ncbi:peptidase [Streptomyces populi]|uniref:Peptidase n=1 Tax=Streptomyces populi TaxID=2058924 RepID=A0A2I0SHD1_9ACTN|nr:metallopeptidase TldD-related protein [Streptomyces populi]PKT69325.1 peptidase [Streptomyces populi]
MSSTPRDVVERALALSRAAHCAVIVDETDTAWLRWAGDDVTAAGTSGTRRVTVVSTGRGGDAAASATLEDVHDPRDLADLVHASRSLADRAGGTPPPLEPVSGSGVDPDADEPTGAVPAQDQLNSVIPELTRLQADGRIASHGFAQHRTVTSWLGTSAGVRRRHRRPTSTLDLNALSPDGTRTAWAGAVADGFRDVDLAAMRAATTGRLRQPLPYRELPPGRYETILAPAAVADLMTVAYRAAGAADAAGGRTVFARTSGGTRIGERLAALPLNLRGDPLETGLACCPFVLSRGDVSDVFGEAVQSGSDPSDNGLALSSTHWMKDGTLTALPASRADAHRLGLPARPAIGNLILDGGTERSLSEMIRSTRRGLLITCLWYMRPTEAATLSLTGLTRDGVHLVEDGRVSAYVNDFRFAESPVSLLARATEAGRTERAPGREFGMHFPRTAMPPLRIPDFRLTARAPSAHG